MGQLLSQLYELEQEAGLTDNAKKDNSEIISFPDLANLPPEISLLVLSKLNATDLCLAACVWQRLGNDEILWHSLCRIEWRWVSIYNNLKIDENFSYRKLYLQLDEATLTFNADYKLGLDYLLKNLLVEDNPLEIARFVQTCKRIDLQKKRELLADRSDVLDEVLKLQNFENQFLPNALRNFFRHTMSRSERENYLSDLVKKFSQRFCACNPQLNFSQDTVYIVCFSLIMLSVDLTSPHVKNKMSKREFIRNTKRAAFGVNDEFIGHLYDNVYLAGPVAPKN